MRREGELVDVRDWELCDRSARGRINDVDALGGGPGEVAAAGRVDAAARVALGAREAGHGRVEGCGVGEADFLEGAEGELRGGRSGGGGSHG